jgi:hypothetical protein
MATYTAVINTPYGPVEVEHDGSPSDQELVEMGRKKLKEKMFLKDFETSETPQELAVTKAEMPRDVEPVDEEEENPRRPFKRCNKWCSRSCWCRRRFNFRRVIQCCKA